MTTTNRPPHPLWLALHNGTDDERRAAGRAWMEAGMPLYAPELPPSQFQGLLGSWIDAAQAVVTACASNGPNPRSLMDEPVLGLVTTLDFGNLAHVLRRAVAIGTRLEAENAALHKRALDADAEVGALNERIKELESDAAFTATQLAKAEAEVSRLVNGLPASTYVEREAVAALASWLREAPAKWSDIKQEVVRALEKLGDGEVGCIEARVYGPEEG